MNWTIRRGAGRAVVLLTTGLVAAGFLVYWQYGRGPRKLTLTWPVVQDVGGLKDDSVCLVCHLDLENEEIAAAHLKAGIVCAMCHGVSEAHRSDELNITPPEMLFGRSEIDPFCKACHPTHTSGKQYQIFVKEWAGRRRPNGRMVNADSVCTDCHGHHVILAPEQQTAG